MKTFMVGIIVMTVIVVLVAGGSIVYRLPHNIMDMDAEYKRILPFGILTDGEVVLHLGIADEYGRYRKLLGTA